MFTTVTSHRPAVIMPETDRINALVDDATKKFDDMDKKLKVVIENLKEQHACMVQLSRCRFKTAMQVEWFVVSTPLSSVVNDKKEPEEFLSSLVVNNDDQRNQVMDDASSLTSMDTSDENRSILNVDTESFMAVHKAIYNISSQYNDQFSAEVLQYVQNWERTISTRFNSLLLQYQGLHQLAMHYHTKVLGLQNKVTRSKNTNPVLAEKLERNEIKKKGAYEARDTVGERLWLFIDETVSRAWKDFLPLLYKACNFEASLSDEQASLFANLNKVGKELEEIGEDWGCDLEGRLDELTKDHAAEIYTVENPFITPKAECPEPKEISLPLSYVPSVDDAFDENQQTVGDWLKPRPLKQQDMPTATPGREASTAHHLSTLSLQDFPTTPQHGSIPTLKMRLNETIDPFLTQESGMHHGMSVESPNTVHQFSQWDETHVTWLSPGEGLLETGEAMPPICRPRAYGQNAFYVTDCLPSNLMMPNL